MPYQRGSAFYSDFIFEGKKYRKSWGPVNRTTAREKESAWKSEIRSGKYAQRLRRITFDALAEKVIEWGKDNRKPNTVYRWNESRIKLKPHLGGKPIAAITAELAEQFKKARLQETTRARGRRMGR